METTLRNPLSLEERIREEILELEKKILTTKLVTTIETVNTN